MTGLYFFFSDQSNPFLFLSIIHPPVYSTLAFPLCLRALIPFFGLSYIILFKASFIIVILYYSKRVLSRKSPKPACFRQVSTGFPCSRATRPPYSPRRLSLFCVQYHISKTFAGLGALGLDNMRVDIIRCADLTVAQHIGDRHHINTIRNQQRCCCMAKKRAD